MYSNKPSDIFTKRGKSSDFSKKSFLMVKCKKTPPETWSHFDNRGSHSRWCPADILQRAKLYKKGCDPRFGIFLLPHLTSHFFTVARSVLKRTNIH